MIKLAERTAPDKVQMKELQSLVAMGEGPHLEFKRKAAFPDKIVKEIIAFANTDGGTLLIGVDDDKNIAGVKYPEEELHAVQRAVSLYCRPALSYKKEVVPINSKKFILKLDVPKSKNRPHYFLSTDRKRETFIRVNDMSMKASREMEEIVRRAKFKSNIQFTYGEHESWLMKFLQQNKTITLAQFCKLAGLREFIASRKLITLVLADVIRIVPSPAGDLYSRI